MTKPCIICVAITGSLPTKANNPAVPITVSEQIESTHEAFEAGAAIVHAHVRNDDETPSSDPEKFAALKEGIERHCPGMSMPFSAGARAGAPLAARTWMSSSRRARCSSCETTCAGRRAWRPACPRRRL